jgi:hypothetical protein
MGTPVTIASVVEFHPQCVKKQPALGRLQTFIFNSCEMPLTIVCPFVAYAEMILYYTCGSMGQYLQLRAKINN